MMLTLVRPTCKLVQSFTKTDGVTHLVFKFVGGRKSTPMIPRYDSSLLGKKGEAHESSKIRAHLGKV